MPYPFKKEKKKDWFDTHVEVIGVDEETNLTVTKIIKGKLYDTDESRRKHAKK